MFETGLVDMFDEAAIEEVIQIYVATSYSSPDARASNGALSPHP